MTNPVPDSPNNPNVEIKEVDDREWDDNGQLKGGEVRQVVLVDGKEQPQSFSPGHHIETRDDSVSSADVSAPVGSGSHAAPDATPAAAESATPA